MNEGNFQRYPCTPNDKKGLSPSVACALIVMSTAFPILRFAWKKIRLLVDAPVNDCVKNLIDIIPRGIGSENPTCATLLGTDFDIRSASSPEKSH